MTYKLSAISLKRLKGVHPSLVKLVIEAIKTTPVDFCVNYGLRTTEEQIALYKAKRSKCDGIIKKSNHQVKSDGYGHAVDLYPVGYNSDPTLYKKLADHIKATAKKLNIKIAWGGDWVSFVDKPHYELA